MAGKKPNPVDAHVGSRVRLRRMLLGMSQERLGESMGLTFQQVQKYEKGVNRVGAGRLTKIAEVLGVPVGTVRSRLHHAMRGLRAALDADARPAVREVAP